MTADANLHTRLLSATSALTVAEERTPEELAAALRAVVELHAPVDRGYAIDCEGCDEPEQPEGCGYPSWPCSTIQAIADQLGLTEGERS